jgi:uncharacterized lipoprotein YmbA
MPRIPRIYSQTAAIPRRALTLLSGAITACVLTSCAFLQPRADPTKFYVLAAPNASWQPAAAEEPVRYKIGLRSIVMPAYLRTKLMVVRTGANEIHFAEFDRWAEPLDEGISRVMKAALRADDNMEILGLNSHGDDTLDYEVTIGVAACEGVRGESGTGSILLRMTWEIHTVGTNEAVIKRGTFTAPPAAWDGKDYGQLAWQLNQAIAAAGKALAADLPVKAQVANESKAEAARQ